MATSILARRCGAAIILFAMSCLAQAQTVGLHLLSAHQKGGYHSVTPGLYIRSSNGLTAGIYRNSCGRISTYVGMTWEHDAALSPAITIGAVTGYPSAPVMPLLVPSVAMKIEQNMSARLALIPKPPTGSHSSSALHFSLERKF